ncbi:NADH-quinone oxidoreductase subunit K [Azohydromonas sediminis]|uniref:NADH-quinone oxidoreductase subunit K n=1 Tax=Azohydromonas sediminis TaxID=2259674 RepID=UPI000E6475AA|nr:NADH-quinone oxidoreductase subunit K [Azohydromonas sediminis]
MIWAFALSVWITVTVGVYLAMSRDALRVVLGLALLGSAINVLLFASGRLGATLPAVVPAGGDVLAADAANPLPQALVLTAIVIGFALVCFSLVLVLRLIRDAGTDDALELRHAEPHPTDPVKPPLPAPGTEPEVEPATVEAMGADRP